MQISPELQTSIGQLAVQKGMIQSSQLDELVTKWSQSDQPTELGLFLVQSGVLTDAQLQSLHQEVELTRARAWGARFRPGERHAQGGLGEVFKAADQELRREVALKQLKRNLSTSPDLRERFFVEAELTGGLEHPGIVPVYGLGVNADGIPFYAMRFIRGRSLRVAASEFHSEKLAPREHSIAFRKLLNQFVSICQTLHFAHSRGVLHRDIKPDNIMLGEFGETIIVDWGIAKVINRSGPIPANESEPPSDRPSWQVRGSSSETQQGTVVGTPGYMSPEQALGWIDSLDARSDVFSLGATLFFILTGRGAYADELGVHDLLVATCAGNSLKPRQVQSAIPRSLAAICEKAMSVKKLDRYRTARELSDDLEAYLADEPVSAWQEPLSARLARLARRYRSLVLTGGIGLILLTAVSITAAGLINQQKNVAQNQRAKAVILANEKEVLADQEREARKLADEQRAQAIAAKDETEQVLEFLVAAFRSPDPLRDGRTVTVAETLENAREQLENTLGDQPLRRAALLLAISETYKGLGMFADSLAAAEQSLSLRTEHLGPNHLETLDARSQLGISLLANGQAEEALEQQLQVVKDREAALGSEDLDTLISKSNLGDCLGSLGRVQESIELYETILTPLEKQFGDAHHVTLLVLGNLSGAYESVGRFEDAIRLGERTVRGSSKFFGPTSIETMRHSEQLASAYDQAGQTTKGRELRLAIVRERKEQLGDSHPHTLAAILNLSSHYAENRNLEEAHQLLVDALPQIEKRLGKKHYYYLVATNKLANCLGRMGQLEEALELHQQNLADCRHELGDAHPQTLIALDNLAVTLNYMGRIKEAIPKMKELYQLRAQLHGQADRRTLTTLNNYAHALLSEGELTLCESLFERLVSGWKEVDPKPNSFSHVAVEGWTTLLLQKQDFQKLLPIARQWLGDCQGDEIVDRFRRARAKQVVAESLIALDQLDEGEKLINEALDEFKALGTEGLVQANAVCLLAELLTKQGKFDEAKELLDEAFPILEEKIKKWPKYTWYRLERACEFQVHLCEASNKPDEAVKWREKLKTLRVEPPK